MKKYNAFYRDDPENGPLADEYGIVMGTSHHEPMTRAYYEQQKLMTGNWDWSTNMNNVAKFMEEGVERSKDWETLYTMGMRGYGDRESPTLNSTQLEEIIQRQQGMIEEYVNKPLEQVGQTWSLYKVRPPSHLSFSSVAYSIPGSRQILGSRHERLRTCHSNVDRRQLWQPPSRAHIG
jgi:hypothetical protein